MENECVIDHRVLTELLNGLCSRYPFVRRFSLGTSVEGREIPALSLGDVKCEKSIVYVAVHHATEHICANVLIRFLREFCAAANADSTVCGVRAAGMLTRRRITVIPMLNPDGVELHLHGPGKDHPLAARLYEMSGGDFSRWQANGRGVDLNHNYNARFDEYKKIEAEKNIVPGPTLYSGEAPESEPESAALCSFLRFDTSVRAVISLHTQGEVIYTGGDAAPVGARSLARTVARMTGYELAETEGTASYGGLTDWFVREFCRPALTLELGRGQNPLPSRDAFPIYAAVREALFCLPYLV